MKPLGICINLLSRERTHENDGMDIIQFLEDNNIPYEFIDCYSTDIISKLDNYSGIWWWYSNFVVADILEAQHILDIAENKGLKVYPDHNTAWHFDDKVAEMYAFQSVSAPIPDSWVFYRREDCEEWLKIKAHYPIVAKLRSGSGSNNVKLLNSSSEAIQYCHRMFSRGYQPAPSILYKTRSKIQSTHDWKTFVIRFKQIPNFLKARKYGQRMSIERDYCYFQEFIPNDGFDIKVAVVGDKLSYLLRSNRKGDFRASGGGSIYYDKSIITDQIIQDAFRVADELKFQCMGYDFVIDKRNGVGKIVEMCHGFDRKAIYDAGGYFDRDCRWHNEPLHVSNEVLRKMYNVDYKSIEDSL